MPLGPWDTQKAVHMLHQLAWPKIPQPDDMIANTATGCHKTPGVWSGLCVSLGSTGAIQNAPPCLEAPHTRRTALSASALPTMHIGQGQVVCSKPFQGILAHCNSVKQDTL